VKVNYDKTGYVQVPLHQFMATKISTFLFIICITCLFSFVGCKSKSKKPVHIIARSPQELQQKIPDIIQGYIELAIDSNGKIDDSTILKQFRLTQLIYEKNQFEPAWSKTERWLLTGDSLYSFIVNAQLLGLFPEDYHVKELAAIKKRFSIDTAAKADRKDVSLWSKADLLLTDAFLQIVKDVRLGRLPQDSITLRKDSILTDEFYKEQFAIVQHSASLPLVISSLEPKQRGYDSLKAGIKKFLNNADYRSFTTVPSTGSDPTLFKKALQQRLYEGGFITNDSTEVDSLHLMAAVKKFQLKKGITADGKAGEVTIRLLNMSDREKFIRIAISMDKYKMLPEKMPGKYVWVNLPGYYMQLIEDDSVKISSKVICGKPLTRTPQLTSAISEMITYPQWTVPNSIIVKEILPGVKKDPGYISQKGFSLLDKEGNEVDPFLVDWSKYSKGIPYKVIQGSGDENALGVLKFNFNNKYSVYLHDTNQRHLFGLTTRALSHGCVRVQEWQSLANYILKNDSLNASGHNYTKSDSLLTWLNKKEKHSIPVRNRIPLFIRYFTVDAKNGNIVFYDDIYGEDKWLKEKYFPGK
jgi:murein L,D-transpeptidase YcbB/YkuD